MTTPDLPRRFVVRHADDGTWGVWDTMINAARSTGLDRARAEQHAADLELQFDAWGPRPGPSVRAVRPAVPVDGADWKRAGLLDHWIRVRADQSLVPRFAWYGRVRTDDGTFVWLPAEDLRKADPTS